MRTSLLARAAILTLAVALEACFVDTRTTNDAAAAFAKARAEAAEVQGKPGRPGKLKALVFEPEKRELTEISVPMWLWRKVGKDVDFGDGAEMAEALRPDALDRAGRGLLLEVVEEDGGQVLVWLR
ncbi:MAG TPA: hypothetical protein VFM88_03065 [Vicinamibacteria bacterium]|nr:hypothetical protein [Vicinamibacteria bacterium]